MISNSVILRGVRIADPEIGATGDRPFDIQIEKGRVVAVAPSGELKALGAEIIEGGGKFALPGLIDCHVHSCGFFTTDLPGVLDMPWMLRQIGMNYRATLKSGVTTFRDMCAPLRLIRILRNRASDPRSGYPRLLCSGPILTIATGYPPHLPPDEFILRQLLGPTRVELTGNTDAAKWVDRLAEAKVDCIKIAYSSKKYDAARSPLAYPSPELMRTIIDRAHHHNLPAAVHHTWLSDLQKLVDLPFDSVEHLTGDEDIDPVTLDKIAKRGLHFTTNLEVFDLLDHPENTLARIESGDAMLMPKAHKGMIKILADIKAQKDLYALKPPVLLFGIKSLLGSAVHEEKNLKLLHDWGVTIGSATDSGLPLLFGSLPYELCHMEKAGMSRAAALKAATSDAARVINLKDAGRIAKGYIADIVLYANDPLKDLNVLKKPEMVIREGVRVI